MAALWLKVLEVPDTQDCVEWITARPGYGQVYYKKKVWATHRLSFIFHCGPIPDGLLVCHLCDNPNCFNPRHLFLGTGKDNMQDCSRKGRTFRPIGEKCGAAVLTEADVRKMRALYRPYTRGCGWRSLGTMFGVDRSTARSAVLGDSWSHL